MAAEKDSTFTQRVPIGLQIAIMLIPMLNIGLGVITPVIQTIANQFPEYPLSTIMLAQTMPNLFMIPCALLSGILAGRGALTYRRMVIFGAAVYSAAGLVPLFMHDSFMTILVCRAVYGIGSGTLYPLAQICVYNYIPRRTDQSRVLGNNTVAMNLGGIFFQYAAGMLATIQWYYCFACYFIGLLTLFAAIAWLKKPAYAEEFEEEVVQEEKLPFGEAVKKVPAFVWIMVICFFISSSTSSPGTNMMSSYIGQNGIGDSGTTALVLIFYQIGSLVTGPLFFKIFKVLGRWSCGVGWAIMGIGFFFMYFGPKMIPWLMFCEFFRGIGFMIWFPCIQQEIGMFCPKGVDSAVAGIQMCMMNLAMFVGGYYATLAANALGFEDKFFIWVVSGVIQCAVAVLLIAVHAKDRPEFHAVKEGTD